MKNKKGFTLIELLAVIVILAIIALIAVPQILKILNKARLNAAKDSTYGIVKAAETYATNFMLENNGSLPKEDLVFNCSSYGCLLENNLENYNTTNLDKLSFKGTKPTSGKITISNNGKTIKAEDLIINDFRCNYDKEVSCGDVDASEIPTPPVILITPTATPSPSGYSQSKTVTVNYTGDGTYLVMPTVNVKTNVSAITCRDVEDASFNCDGEVINTYGTLIANRWYKVESNPTLTIEENGSIYYKVTDGTNYKDGGSLTITEIDRTAPTVASVTQRSATTNSITVTASGTDSESNIVRYQFSIDNGEWLPSEPQESNEHTFTDVSSGEHQIKVRVINGTFINNGQNDLNTKESHTITMSAGELTQPEAEVNPGGWSQSKTATITFTGTGTYLIRPSIDVTTNVEAVTCRDVEDASFTCDGETINTNGTLIANTWYKVESNPTLTIEENGSIYYKVTDGINYKDGGSLTITEIDRIAPILNVTYKTADGNPYVYDTWTNQNIIATLSVTDEIGEIDYYQVTYDGAHFQNIDKNTTTITYDTDNRTGIWFRAIDKAGNIGPLSETNVIAIDKTPPKVTYSIEGGTYHLPQTVRVTVDDDNLMYMHVHVYNAGALYYANKVDNKSIDYASKNTFDVVLDGNGPWTIYTFAIDNAGNGLQQNPNIDYWYYREYNLLVTPTSENPPSGVTGYTGVKKIVYLDPTNLNKGCNASNVNSATGTKTGCMKWYAYAETDSTYTMILDHNTTAGWPWVSKVDYIAAGGTEMDWGTDGNNNKGPLSLKKRLENDTIEWDSNLTPRLLNQLEISNIVEQQPSQYGWLFDRTGGSCQSAGCLNNSTSGGAYWLGTSSSSNSIYAKLMFDIGVIGDHIVSHGNVGLRPVITVEKSKIA